MKTSSSNSNRLKIRILYSKTIATMMKVQVGHMVVAILKRKRSSRYSQISECSNSSHRPISTISIRLTLQIIILSIRTRYIRCSSIHSRWMMKHKIRMMIIWKTTISKNIICQRRIHNRINN